MQKKYYLFRHGETSVTKSKMLLPFYGLKHFSAKTLPEGVKKTENIGNFLKNESIDYFVCSSYLRCQETAAIVSKKINKKVATDKRIDSFFIETPWHFTKRIKDFITDMEASKYRNIAICTHGLVLAVMSKMLTKERFAFLDMFSLLMPGEMLMIKEMKRIKKNFL